MSQLKSSPHLKEKPYCYRRNLKIELTLVTAAMVGCLLSTPGRLVVENNKRMNTKHVENNF